MPTPDQPRVEVGTTPALDELELVHTGSVVPPEITCVVIGLALADAQANHPGVEVVSSRSHDMDGADHAPGWGDTTPHHWG